MKREQMEAIAARAARLARSTLNAEDKQFWAEMGLDPYHEYLDQLRTCLLYTSDAADEL